MVTDVSGTTYRVSYSWISWPLKSTPVRCTETLIIDYKRTPRNIPEEQMPQLVLVMSRYCGYAVAQLLEALCYKSEGRGFDSRWCLWNFSLK
jgi:hypothetical protein